MSEDETVAEATDQGTIVDVAVGAGEFTTLVAAVQAADLVDTLSGEGPFTVFAPTDDAFAALPPELIEAYASGRVDYYGMYKRKYAGEDIDL